MEFFPGKYGPERNSVFGDFSRSELDKFFHSRYFKLYYSDDSNLW